MNKIVRTISLFKKHPDGSEPERLQNLQLKLEAAGYQVQTKRLCSPVNFGGLAEFSQQGIITSIGTVRFDWAKANLEKFYATNDNFNIELAEETLSLGHVKILFEIINNAPAKTFNFTYVFNNAPSSPYMPSASYKQDGFAVGLQPTDLAAGANNLEEWFSRLKTVYNELVEIFAGEPDFLGIDSSIAPLFKGSSSIVNFIKKIYPDGFSQSLTTDIYTRITKFIKEENPRPIGLCGLMLACLEDFELAEEYEQGNFSIERNIFASLHSGLGIDTYPIGVNESPERVLEVLKLLQALSNKYKKPLSARFVSDGVAKIGEKTDYRNQYLYDVTVRRL
jgi:uncharacterized protein (UPF0210 family)